MYDSAFHVDRYLKMTADVSPLMGTELLGGRLSSISSMNDDLYLFNTHVTMHGFI